MWEMLNITGEQRVLPNQRRFLWIREKGWVRTMDQTVYSKTSACVGEDTSEDERRHQWSWSSSFIVYFEVEVTIVGWYGGFPLHRHSNFFKTIN